MEFWRGKNSGILGGKNTGVGCHFLLQWTFLSPVDWTWISCIAGKFFTVWTTRVSLFTIDEFPGITVSRGLFLLQNGTWLWLLDGLFYFHRGDILWYCLWSWEEWEEEEKKEKGTLSYCKWLTPMCGRLKTCLSPISLIFRSSVSFHILIFVEC